MYNNTKNAYKAINNSFVHTLDINICYNYPRFIYWQVSLIMNIRK